MTKTSSIEFKASKSHLSLLEKLSNANGISGNEAEIRTFLERSLDIVIGIEFIKMLAKHSPGSSLEVDAGPQRGGLACGPQREVRPRNTSGLASYADNPVRRSTTR